MLRLRSSRVWPAVLLGAFFLCLYLLTGAADLLHNGDTNLRYQTTQAIVDAGRLWVAHPFYTDTRMALGLGGHLYAFYAPGQILFMAPLYIAGKVIAHHLSLPYDTTTLYAARSLDLFLGAALAVLFYCFALVAGYSTRIAVILTLLFGTATVTWPDAQSALEQTQVNLFLLLGVMGLWQFLRTGRTDRRWLALAGLGAGFAVFTRYDAVIYVPALAAFLAFVRSRWREMGALARDLLVFAAVCLPFGGAILAWNAARFGNPFQTGLHEATLGNPFFLGVAELTVSPGKGLLWYLPLMLLLPWCALRFARRVPELAQLCALLVLLPLLFYANILYWHGDPAWGPRYLYVAVPYLILPLGEILATWPRRGVALRAAFILLTAIGLTLSISYVSVTQWRYWYHLEAIQERGASGDNWTGQPFRWGASHYHYYWDVTESPLLWQPRDLYEVIALQLGDQSYRLTKQPDAYVHSNPALGYPVNTFNFWWTDPIQPLLGPHTRDGLAAGLGVIGLGALLLLLLSLRSVPVEKSAGARESQLATARTASG